MENSKENSMTVKIEKPIVSFNIVKEDKPEVTVKKEKPTVEKMSERVKRPESLHGETYKIKPPQSVRLVRVENSLNDSIEFSKSSYLSN